MNRFPRRYHIGPVHRLVQLPAILLSAAFFHSGGVARAIPSLTPHTHNNPGIVDHDTTWLRVPEEVPDPDPDFPDQRLHQHRDRDPLIGGNGKYIGARVWDNNQYRLQEEFGHGYQAEPARYTFRPAMPEAARADFRAGVTEWEQAVNGNEINVNGVPISILMDYEEGGADMDVYWVDLGLTPGKDNSCSPFVALACWVPTTTDFYFDSAIEHTISPTTGFVSVSLTATGPFLPTVEHAFPDGWHFGTGANPGVTAPVSVWQADASGAISGPFQFSYPQYDFYTVSLHELGHSWGLQHFGTGIMREDIAAHIMRDPDAGSIDGMKDLYAIPRPVPEPATCALAVVAMLGLAATRRKPRCL